MTEHAQPPAANQVRSTIASIATVVLLFVFFLCLASPAANAQVLYGVLTGNVTDSSGAAIANADVEALNVATGIKSNAKTDNSGIYRFNDLQAGNYTVTVTAQGFSTLISQNNVLGVNQVRRVDAQLKIASQEQQVTVTAEAQALQTDKADVHTDLSSRQVEDLPTSGSQGRNFQKLLQVIPGAGLAAETNSISGNTQRAINVNMNGQSNQGVNTRIDGASDAYPWLPANVAYVPPADAIQEVNVTTNSMDAEQGQAGGAAVNVQIKSGTNQYHGTGSWFHTDQNFAAQNYFNAPGSKIPRNNQNAFGGTFGGPIIKDKLFFFVDYERTTQRNKAGPDNRLFPTATELGGDFSAFVPAVGSTNATFSPGKDANGKPLPPPPFVDCNTTPAAGCIYDPATGNNTGAGKQQVNCNGVGNVICANRIDPATIAMTQLLQPTLAAEFPASGTANNFSGTGTALFNRDNADFKINYNPSDRSTIFGRYSFSKSLVFDPPLLGDAGGDAANGGQLGNAPGLIQSIGLGGTYTFTPHTLLDWNFGFTRQRIAAQFDLASPKGTDLLKISGTNDVGVPGAGDLYNGLPAFFLCQNTGCSTTSNLGNPNTGNPFLFRDNQFVGGANLGWTHGKHNVRGGFEWDHAAINHFQPQGGTFQTARGSFRFNGTVTEVNSTSTLISTPAWVNTIADFDLGLPDETGKAYQLTNPIALRWNQWAAYIRDQWQITPNITLNAGVRWEFYPFGYSDNGDGFRWLNTANGNVYIGGNGNVPQDDGVDVGHGQFLPRVGVSWRLHGSTVVRAGYGMSADPNNWRYFRNSYPAAVISDNTNPTGNTANNVAVASLTGLNANLGSYTVPTGLVNLPTPDLSSGVVALPTGASTTTIPSPFHRGYINSYNLTIEHEFKGFLFQTGYVGAYDVRPLVNMNLNASAPGGGQAGGLLSVALGQVYKGTINGLVPFKDSNYNSLQTKLTRRFGNGSSFGFVWTWSKDLDYEDNEELNSLSFPYPAYWYKNYGPASFDRTHNIEIYGVMQLPFGKGQKWLTSGVAGHVLGGWQVSPLISYLTGLPFTVGGNGTPLNANGSSQTADQVGAFNIIGGAPLPSGSSCAATNLSCHYFDPSAFAQPANGVYGNTNRDSFRGPGYFTMNLSLAREFSLTERFKLQARADAIGFTNTPHFANPNTTCCASTNSSFGEITGTLTPGGFFGPDPGSRVVWLGLRLTF